MPALPDHDGTEPDMSEPTEDHADDQSPDPPDRDRFLALPIPTTDQNGYAR